MFKWIVSMAALGLLVLPLRAGELDGGAAKSGFRIGQAALTSATITPDTAKVATGSELDRESPQQSCRWRGGWGCGPTFVSWGGGWRGGWGGGGWGGGGWGGCGPRFSSFVAYQPVGWSVGYSSWGGGWGGWGGGWGGCW